MPFRPLSTKSRNLAGEQSGNGPTTLPHLEALSRVGDSPPDSAPLSRTMASSTSLPYGHGQQNYFRSRRIKKGELERPWLNQKDPREKWVTIIPIIGFLCGLAVAGLLIWMGLWTVVDHNYCAVLDEDFSSWNDKVWTKEVEVGGYG